VDGGLLFDEDHHLYDITGHSPTDYSSRGTLRSVGDDFEEWA